MTDQVCPCECCQGIPPKPLQWGILFDVLDGVATTPGGVNHLPKYFRLLDGDGEIYMYGRASEECFEPLDRYKDDLGCTSIQYFNDNNQEWEEL